MESAAGTRCYAEELASDLFDQIDDLLEFPNDDELLIEMVGPSVSVNDNLAPIITPSVEPMLLPLTEDVFTSETQGNSSNGPALVKTGDISSAEEDHLGPYDELEMTQLEWLANFFDEPPSASSSPLENPITISPSNKSPTNIKCTTTTPTPTLSLPMPTDTITKDHDPSLLFRTSSPVSVLEQTSFSNGGSSGGSSTSTTSFLSSASSFSSNNFSRGSLSPRSVAPLVPNFVVPVRPRSKRPRPSSFSVSRLISTPFLPPSLEIESIAESDPVLAPIPLPASEHLPAHIKKKKKGPRKNSFLDEEEPKWGHIQDHATAARRCMHCRIEKTPQWRAGPMGPKTLCNACGVRYKSGRLFPEYRPAASPTFVPSIHSNSHKKVVEMRLMTTSNSGRGTNLLGFISKRG